MNATDDNSSTEPAAAVPLRQLKGPGAASSDDWLFPTKSMLAWRLQASCPIVILASSHGSHHLSPSLPQDKRVLHRDCGDNNERQDRWTIRAGGFSACRTSCCLSLFGAICCARSSSAAAVEQPSSALSAASSCIPTMQHLAGRSSS